MIAFAKGGYSRKTILRHSEIFRGICNLQELASTIGIDPHQIQLLAAKPSYRVYEIPKRSGGYRLIEDPEPKLKYCLKRINHLLQCTYYSIRPSVVFGFTISARNDDTPCTIYSNARLHAGAKYLLNIDLKDFFHQISAERVLSILDVNFPKLDPTLKKLMCYLTTRLNRLPMGAPTSPVLSNYACLEMDAELMKIAKSSNMVYSRFADDLSFSSNTAITKTDTNLFLDVIEHHRLMVNPKKIKIYGAEDVKLVTGLVVTDKIDLPDGYIKNLETEIDRLRSVMLVEGRYRTGMSYKKLKLLMQELNGKISFASMILGPDDQTIEQLKIQFNHALQLPEEELLQSWMDIPYQF